MNIIRKIKNWVVMNNRVINYMKYSQSFPMKQIRKQIRNKNMRSHYPLSLYCAISPERIAIETTNFCNTSCLFCPHNIMKRKKENMDMDLFKKAVDDSYDLGVKHIMLSFFGEPLVDKLIFDRIKYIKDKDMECSFFTNAIGLNDEVIKKIINSKIDRIFISLDAINEDYWKKIRATGNYNTIVFNIAKLLLKNKNIKIDIGLLLFDDISKKDVTNFIKKWKMANEVHIRKLHSWTNTKESKKCNLPCYSLWSGTGLGVLSNGNVVPCCMDYEGILKIGNIKKDSLKNIWFSSQKLRHIRELHLEGKKDNLNICKYCSITESNTDPWWYYE